MCPPPVATCDNRLWNCPVARSITSWPICSQQVCRTSAAQHLECNDDGKQAVGMLPRSNSPLSLSLGYSAANFLVPQILTHEDAKTHLFVVIDELMHHPVEKWSCCQTSSACLVVNPDSERRHTNKNCRIWLEAEQTPVIIFLCKFS